ncbi:MAG: RHS repeat-associated core domain-containing protein [Clostridium sp.]|uniref:RHS repeat-associated core domain-containing protein n=1 Tax=Clostridium sp. TaxID=1506 RepID=UPI00305E3B22
MKNPYRYRGYRYDNETGYYYLQSRYYTPEMGRFINADDIIGQTGDILGHNIFGYCKNNPADMSDDSAFRPIYTQGDETDEMRDSSFAAMSSSSANRASSTTSSSGIMSSSVKNGLQDMLIAKKIIDLGDTPDYLLIFFNRAAERSNNGLLIPVEGAGALRTVGKVGIVGTALLGYSTWDNVAYYKHPVARTAISGVGIGLGILAAGVIGTATAPAIIAGVAVGTAIGDFSDVASDKWFGEEK